MRPVKTRKLNAPQNLAEDRHEIIQAEGSPIKHAPILREPKDPHPHSITIRRNDRDKYTLLTGHDHRRLASGVKRLLFFFIPLNG